jgi:hypothetical protein
MCTSTGDGEQTISKIRKNVLFFMGLMPTAGQLICNQIVWVRFPQCPQKKFEKDLADQNRLHIFVEQK